MGLFQDLPEHENMVDAILSLSEASLLLSFDGVCHC
jgi:hypothetical protein